MNLLSKPCNYSNTHITDIKKEMSIIIAAPLKECLHSMYFIRDEISCPHLINEVIVKYQPSPFQKVTSVL